MKIYINRKPKHGPWGGGAKTVNKLWQALQDRGHTVVGRLEADIDLIFCFDPRPNQSGEWYQNFIDYRSLNPKTKILQRVGDLGTHSKPYLTNLVRQTLKMSDYFIFPSLWSKEWIGFSGDNCSVIDNAPMPIFYQNRDESKHIDADDIRIITHHWSTNPKKGFDIYEQFDKWCLGKNYSFHYIGQLPNKISFSNTTRPTSADVLCKVLPTYDIYLTASEEEAGANHVLEAMAAGLPVIYRSTGGSIPNYCENYGEEYSSFNEMLKSLEKITANYSDYKKRVLSYKDTNQDVILKYCQIIESMQDES